MKYGTEKEINKVINDFKSCRIERGTWGHPEHLILAFHYLSNNDFDTAYKKIKNGIFRLLKSFEIDLSKEMPYHETLTVFWMKTINTFIKNEDYDSNVTAIDDLITRFDKDYPLRFYDRETLFSDVARESYIESKSVKMIDQ